MDAIPAPPAATAGARPARMNPWNWVMLIVGVMLTALGMGLLIGGAILMGTDAAQRDGRYLTSNTHRYQSTGHALVGPPLVLDVGTARAPGLPPLSDIASFQVRVTPVIPNQPIFVGIADTSDVATYLEDVPHAVLGGMRWTEEGQFSAPEPWLVDNEDDAQEITGTQVPDAPDAQDFWAASTTGTGTQQLTFDLQEGQWALVVMNAEANRPVWVDAQAGVRTELLDPLNPGLVLAGVIGLVVGLPLLLLGAAGLGRDIDQQPPQPTSVTPGVPGTAVEHSVYPLAFAGHLDGQLSRGLWLVKWLLAIPHYLVLALLWFALVIITIAVGIAILFTGQYPRFWFSFSVGVLRWNWRVGFYAYLVLGTDRYPPFTLARADYPAELAVDYPDRLSRGLVLVKWWLLAIPHLLIVGILTGSGGLVGIGALRNNTGWGISLLGLLVLIAAVALLFTGRYLPGLFSLILGLNRWVYRVSTYVLLLRDEYPPFRLDQGATDPPHQHLP